MKREPKCIIVTGRAGSGKTTLARKLGERLWLPVISRDEIKQGYVNTRGVQHDQLPTNSNRLASDLFFDIVNQHLAGNISVVVEAAFQHNVWEPRMPHIVKLSAPWMILCSADDAVTTQRYLQRGLENQEWGFYHGEGRVSHYRKTGEVPPESYDPPKFDIPTIEVSTDEGYIPSIDEIVKQIRSRDVISQRDDSRTSGV